MSADHDRFDAISADALRASGALKWNAFPDCIGAFVAEMDFGIAPEVEAAVRGALDRGHPVVVVHARSAELAAKAESELSGRGGETVRTL